MIQKIRQNIIPVLFILIFLFALILRLVEIKKYSLWLDECISVFFANKPLHECLVSKFDVQTLLFNVSLCFWVKLFGVSAIAVRYFSLIFGILSVVLIYFVAEKLFKNKTVSLTAMFLFAINPMCIHYSCEARAYLLLCFGTIFSFYCLLNYLKNSNILNTILYIVSAIILLYTHSFGWIFLFIESLFALILIIKTKGTAFIKNWIMSQLIILAFASYIVYMVINGFNTMTTLVSWIKQPDLYIFLKTIYELAGSDWFAKALIVLALIYIITLIFRKIVRIEYPTSIILFLIIWIIFPLILIYFYSTHYHSLFVTRYFIICIPPMILLTSFVINDLLNNKIFKYSTIAIVAVLLLSKVNLNSDLSRTYYEPWEKICQDIKSHKSDKDIIVIEPYFKVFPFFYYYDRDYFDSDKNIFSNISTFNTYYFFYQKDFENTVKDISGKSVWPIIYGSQTLSLGNKIYSYFSNNKKVIYEWYSS